MPGSTPERASASRERAWTSYLAFALYPQLSVAPGNHFFSPFSVLGGLMALRAGAAGATRREVENVLCRRETGEALESSFGALLRHVGHLARPGSGLLELVTANALWCQSGFPMRPAFVETLRTHFGAEAGEVDFSGSAGEAARTVNAWAAEATRGRIRVLLDDVEAAGVKRGILANVVHFTGSWLEPFGEGATWAEPFSLAPGSRVDVPMLHGIGTRHYARIGRLQALHLPYAVSRVRMIVLLPDEGHMETVEGELGSELLRQVIGEAEPRLTRLVLPRCHVESATRLRVPLEALGVVSAFGPAADFSRISDAGRFFLDDVFHRSFVEIDEFGTETATSAVELSGAERQERFSAALELRVDRPFLFLICDTATETVFFVGRVVDPRG